MSDNISLPIFSGSLQQSIILNKPNYLITLIDGKTKKYIITLDKPTFENGFIDVKCILIDNYSEEEIVLKYKDILTNTKRELYLELLIPWHRILMIRSLVFISNKNKKIL